MPLDQDVENAQTDKKKSRKVILIASLVAVVVIFTAACVTVYFSSEKSGAGTESVTGAGTESGIGTGTRNVPVFGKYDPIGESNELVFYNPITQKQKKVNLTNVNCSNDLDNIRLRYDNAQISPNGKFICFMARNVEGSYDFFMLADGNGENLRKFILLDQYDCIDSFGFTPDSNEIIYTTSSLVGSEIRRSSLNGENKEILLSLPQSESGIPRAILNACLLKNGTLFYYINYSWYVHRCTICMKKGPAESFSLRINFQSQLKFIPFGKFVYVVDGSEKVWRFDTDEDVIGIKFKSITVADYPKLYNGTISEDGDVMYLVAHKSGHDEMSDKFEMIRVNIKNAFNNENTQIQIEEIVISSMIKDIAALVPTLSEV